MILPAYNRNGPAWRFVEINGFLLFDIYVGNSTLVNVICDSFMDNKLSYILKQFHLNYYLNYYILKI